MHSESLSRLSSDVEETLAVYIHWPFCVSKCPYCDFNSHVREMVDEEAWETALLQDLAHEAEQIPGPRISSIFFGGGTPSLMPPRTVAALIKAADRHWGLIDDAEITLEANPSSVEASRFADIASAGVNRISLGLQALHDETLHFLGRAHGVTEGLAALDLAQRHYGRVSFDLIYALPDQSEAAWEADLRRALGFGTEHLSLYQLTIEPGTRFATLAGKGALTPMAPDSAATLFEMTDAITREAGLFRYEVSNHARSDAQSRHNLAYWRYQNYVGIGPGAHGRRHGIATVRHKKPENWMSAVRRNGHGLASEDTLTRRQRQTEAMLMGLRLAEGVNLDSHQLNEIIDYAAVRQLEQSGLLSKTGSCLRVTSDGMLLLNSILSEIIS